MSKQKPYKPGDTVLVDGEEATIVRRNIKPVGDDTYTVRFALDNKTLEVSAQWINFQW